MNTSFEKSGPDHRLEGSAARRRWPWHCALLSLVAILGAGCAPRSTGDESSLAASNAATPAATGQADATAVSPAPFLYDVEYPVMDYARPATNNAVARLIQRIEAGDVVLEADPTRGYLDSLLKALDIDAASQMLVFSKTSLQVDLITSATPRAIYFNDDTYVAWVGGANTLEIATLDAALGPVFYELAQPGAPQRGFERALGQCLRCHDSFSMTGGGVPRFITGSGYTGRDGTLVAHEGWILTSDRTPLRSRWGGWYVTGFHGDQVHLGNIAVRSVYELERLEELRLGNIETLDGVLDTSAYLTNRSDIVALLVLEHQVRVQNAIVRANYDVRTALAAAALDADAEVDLTSLGLDLEPLVEALFLAGEAPFTSPVRGTSGFADQFVARGPRDASGRSLRDLDLTMRLFRHPLSYAIYSPAFDALPRSARNSVYLRIAGVLDGRDDSPAYARLTAEDRMAIAQILMQTKPEFAAAAARD
jgi:hypothetical protein